MPRTQANRYIAVNTKLGEDKLLLQSFRVTEQLGRPYEIELSLVTEEASIDAKQLLGSNVSIRMSLTDDGADSRFFNGYVSRFVMAGNAGHIPHYHMTVVPYIWFLGRTSDCRISQNKKAPEIIDDLLNEAGFTDIEPQLSATYVSRDYCVQYRETTLNYCHRLMEEEGIYYFFKHENGKQTLVFADDRAAHPVLGYPLHFLKLPDRNFTQTISEWTVEQEVKSGAYGLLDFNFKTPKSAVKGQVNVPGGYDNDSLEMLDYPGGYDASGEGDRLARVRLEELQATQQVVRGSTNCRELSAGTIFTLADHPDAAQNAEWLVTSVTIDASVTDYSTNKGDGAEHYSCSFTAIPATTPYRSPRVTPEPVIVGPQPALVVGLPGEEIHTDEFGRVKVLFYWDRYSPANDTASIFIRVSQAAAGKQYGTVFLPRIGQEVLVEFTDGDPDRPMVTGVVYNGANKPPYPLPDNKTRTVIKSNSSKGGGGFNELYFEDIKGGEQIYTHAEKDLHLRVKNDRYEFIGHDTNLIVKHDRLEEIGHDDNLHVKAEHKTKVDSDQSLQVGGERAVKIAAADGLTVGADQAIKVSGDQGVDVGGGISQKSGKKISVQSKEDMHLKSGATYAMEAATSVHIKAGTTMVLEAGVQLSLKVGGNFVDIGPAGVAINGTIVMINSGGAAGSGAGSSPDDPAAPHAPKDPGDPKEALDTNPGQVEPPPDDRSHTRSGSTASTTVKPKNPVVISLQSAASSGDAFCEQCAAAAAAQAAQA